MLKELDFGIVRSQAMALNGKGESVYTGHDAIYREGTDHRLGVVSETYAVIDHREIISRVETALEWLGYESKGGGYVSNEVVAKYEFTNRGFGEGVERHLPGVIISNSYDGGTSAIIQTTFKRLSCLNGAIHPGRSALISRMIHRGTPVLPKVEEIAATLRETVEKNEKEFVETMIKLIGQKPMDWQVLENKFGKRIVARAQGAIEQERALRNGEDSAWVQFNAFTNAVTHHETMKEARKDTQTRNILAFFMGAFV